MKPEIDILQNLPIMAFRYCGAPTDYCFDFVSDGCKKLAGITAEEFTGGASFIELIHPEDASGFLELHESTLAMGAPLEATFRIIVEGGEVKRVWVRSHVSDTDDMGMPFVFEGFFADITKQHLIETSKQANRSVYGFLTNVSHEIRTPMNTILGMAELGLREDSLQKVNDYTRTIKQAGIKLMSVLSDILDYTAIENDQVEIIPEEYILSSFINDVAIIAKEMIADTNLSFEINVEPSLPNVIDGDMIRLRQAVLSLISNAVKFTDNGQIGVSVDGEVIGDELYLNISVSDTGHGIRDEDLPNLFKEFAQFDLKTIEGTGLGLAITDNLVKLMGGRIEVHSVYGVGSIFILRVMQKIKNYDEIGNLTATLSKITKYEEKIVDEACDIVKFIAPNARILIVDDITTNLKVANGLLSSYNMRVDLCMSGMDAIEAVKNHRYDLILMDHMMPVMNGVETTLAIRGLENCNTDCEKVPIIALTANVAYGIKRMFIKNGFDDFIAKPIDVYELNEIMEKWLPHSKKVPQNKIVVKCDDFIPASAPIKIPGVDTEKALMHMDNSTELYISVLISFCETGRKIASEAKDCDIELYAVHAHSLKSLLASIGATQLAKDAVALEYAANKIDMNYINAHSEPFFVNLGVLIDDIEFVIEKEMS